MKKAFIATVLIGVMTLMSSVAFAATKPLVRTSGQPCLHGMPIWYAEKEGWTKESPISTNFRLFASGAPQNEALAAAQWDIGATGAIPTMLAGLRYDAYLIAVSNDESETNDLWVRPDSPLLKTKGTNPKFPEIYGSAADWKGKKILATTMSTGHYALTSTLNALGMADKDVSIVHIEQGQAIAAFNSGEGDIIQLWAPFSYIGQAKGWKKVSSGAKAGAIIIGGVIVRKEFADKNPELVVDWLDLYMRGIEMMKNDPKGSVAPLLSYFTDYCGLELTKEQVELEFKLRPLFNVAEQIDILKNPAKAAAWMDGVAKFMSKQGRIKTSEYERYKKSNYNIEPKFMEMLVARRAAAKK